MSINKDFLNYSETKAHNQQMESHDIKKLSYSKGNCQLNEKQPTDWGAESPWAMYLSDG